MNTFRFFTAVLLVAGAATTLRAQEAAAPEKSMLRVNITSQPYNQMLPWQKTNPGTRRGLGALLPGNRVLVTAELAQDANYTELEIASSGRKLTAKIEAIDYEVNLATIIPEGDPGDFFQGMVPLAVDTALKPKTAIEIWQFENNGAPVTNTMELNRADLGTFFLEDQIFLIFQANGAVQYRGEYQMRANGKDSLFKRVLQNRNADGKGWGRLPKGSTFAVGTTCTQHVFLSRLRFPSDAAVGDRTTGADVGRAGGNHEVVGGCS